MSVSGSLYCELFSKAVGGITYSSFDILSTDL